MAEITSVPWGTTQSGEHISLFTLTNDNGLVAKITNYGGRLVSLLAPDRDGTLADVTLGFDNLAGYFGPNPCFGAIIGRFANRIANARFTIDGTCYQLATNDGANSLHGGAVGFDRRVWEAAPSAPVTPALPLRYLSPDGEENFPGTLDVNVLYSLTNDNELRIDYQATTDKPTILNLTNHAYFNLGGPLSTDVLGHELWIDADAFTAADKNCIPTGEIRPVAGTPFDFRTAVPIGAGIDADDEQIQGSRGYNHNFVLNHSAQDELDLIARVTEPRSGRVLEVLTTQPGVHLYSSGYVDIQVGERHYGKWAAVCLETQHYPDSPNHPEFPSTILRPGESFHQTTLYRFSVV